MSNSKAKTTVYEKQADGKMFPLGQVVPNIDERVRKLENFPDAIVVAVPEVEGNLRLPIGRTSELTVRSHSLLVGVQIAKFVYFVDEGEPKEVMASDDQATISVEIPAGTLENTTFKLTVKAYDAYGSFNSNTVTITAINIGVATPTISGKSTDVVKGEAAFSGSPFQMVGASGNHDKSDWVLYKSNAPEVEVWSSKNDTSNKTNCPSTINDSLESGVQYILKLRYHDSTNDLWSEYGQLQFTMASIAVRTPTLSGTTEDVIGGEGGEASFTGSSFEIIGASSSNHDKSDWVLVKANAPSSELWSSKNDSINKTTSPQSLNAVLEVSSTYIIKVRYHDSVNDVWSEYGQLQFTTASEFLQPWEPVVRTQGIHFKASKQGNRVNFFRHASTLSGCTYKVYINGEPTEQVYNDLTFAAKDDVLIKLESGDKFPSFLADSLDYISEIVEPFPLMYDKDNTLQQIWYRMFNECRTLKTLANKTFANNKIRLPNNMFDGCYSLNNIPEDLFGDDQPLITECTSLFSNCVILSSIPENLFKGWVNVTSLSGIFSGCTALTSVPENLFKTTTKVSYFGSPFRGCTKLVTLPEGLLNGMSQSLTSLSVSFQGCTALTSVPDNFLANLPNLTGVNTCFGDCPSLANLNLKINARNITDVSGFARGSANKGTVRVPSGSTTAATFKSAGDANVNVVEE